MTADELREQLEVDVVEMLKEKQAEGAITEERSRTIAQHVLDSLKPGMSFEELYKAIPKLDDHFPEISPLILPILRDYENTVVKKAQENVSELIRQGQYDAAEKLAQKAIGQDTDVVYQGSASPD